MRKNIISILLVLGGCAAALAQETIAVHPLDNNEGTPMEAIFNEELQRAIPRVPNYEGAFTTYLIDLIFNRPEDVPEGGFPSYICPPVSLTKGAPYAITGEIGEDADYPGEYWVRLYLWDMESGEMLVTDMASAWDRESAADNYPWLLEYMFSKIEDRRRTGRATQADSLYDTYLLLRRLGLHTKYWLLLGVQAGAGSATWKLPEVATDNLNLSFAVNAVGNIFYPLSIQLEANMQGYIALGAEDTSTTWNLAIPLLLRYSLFTGKFNASVYIGHWLSFTLSVPEETYIEQLPAWNSAIGIACGMSIGWELGQRGNLFLDGRFYHLIDYVDKDRTYPFNGFVFSIGYQVGLIEKKSK